MTRITANITAYSAMSWPSSFLSMSRIGSSILSPRSFLDSSAIGVADVGAG
jgi:hypothetical protein